MLEFKLHPKTLATKPWILYVMARVETEYYIFRCFLGAAVGKIMETDKFYASAHTHTHTQYVQFHFWRHFIKFE